MANIYFQTIVRTLCSLLLLWRWYLPRVRYVPSEVLSTLSALGMSNAYTVLLVLRGRGFLSDGVSFF